jgi:hypothetical protein
MDYEPFAESKKFYPVEEEITVNSPFEIRIFAAISHASTEEPFHRHPKTRHHPAPEHRS